MANPNDPNERGEGIIGTLNDLLEKHVVPGAEKLASALSHVHTPDKEYPIESPDSANIVDAEFTEYRFRGAIGGTVGSDGRGIVWHVFHHQEDGPIPALCGEHHSPMGWLRDSVRGSIIVCAACLRVVTGQSNHRKQLAP